MRPRQAIKLYSICRVASSALRQASGSIQALRRNILFSRRRSSIWDGQGEWSRWMTGAALAGDQQLFDPSSCFPHAQAGQRIDPGAAPEPSQLKVQFM